MNDSFKAIAAALLFAAISLLFPVQAFAQATRTWVSGVGDDFNPCSRTAPCKTFAGAISKTAAGGEINCIDPGGYGTLTITKSITIDCGGTFGSTLNSGGINGFVINDSLSAAPGTSEVILRNLSINGSGTTLGLNGIRFISGSKLYVENVSIFSQSGQGISFQPAGASSLFVNRTTINRSAGGAIHIIPSVGGSASVTLNQVTMQGNGRGLRAEDRSTVAVSNSIASGNDANGFVALATTNPVAMTLENTVSTRNGQVGVYSGALTTVRISNVMSTHNNVGLQAVGGGAIISFGNNRVHGNAGGDGAPTASTSQL